MILCCLESPRHIRGASSGRSYHLRAVQGWVPCPREHRGGSWGEYEVHQQEGYRSLHRPQELQDLQGPQQGMLVQGVHGWDGRRDRPEAPLNAGHQTGEPAYRQASPFAQSASLHSDRATSEDPRCPSTNFSPIPFRVFFYCIFLLYRQPTKNKTPPCCQRRSLNSFFFSLFSKDHGHFQLLFYHCSHLHPYLWK